MSASIAGRSGRFRWSHEAVLVVLLVVLFIWAAVVDPAFLSWRVQKHLSTHIWELAILAIPMALIILTAGIDLSVGSTMALCAVVLGLTYDAGFSPWLGAAAAIGCGSLAGAANGLFITRVNVHPLIVTLATLAAYRGIALGVSRAEPVSGFPESFAFLGRGELAGLPVPAIIFLLGFAAAALVLTRMPAGRFIYAIGFNETAVRLSGINVDRIKLTLYTLAGTAAGISGVLFVARRNTAKADIAMGMELEVITAVVLGGVSIFGGRGHLLGVVLGIILMHETREFVSWHWNRDELNLIIIGMLLIGAVLLNRILSPRRPG